MPGAIIGKGIRRKYAALVVELHSNTLRNVPRLFTDTLLARQAELSGCKLIVPNCCFGSLIVWRGCCVVVFDLSVEHSDHTLPALGDVRVMGDYDHRGALVLVQLAQ